MAKPVTPLWDKAGIAVDERLHRFLAGEDLLLDRALFPFDLWASAAHVRGLARIGVLSLDEAEGIDRELSALGALFAEGKVDFDARFEDGHSVIEAHLVEKLGETGKKVHTGRSRNDQVLVAMRLYVRDALVRLADLCLDIAEALLDRAEADALTPMPGYTHLQRAVPSSIGLWLSGFAEAFLDDAALAWTTDAWIDCCPLGTAAGYGVNLPLDREGVAKELRFARLQQSPVYAQNSRGKLELQVLSVLHQPLLDLRRLAWDLSLYTTAEYGFVRLPAKYTTGSSIMPNKRNPDVVELLRAAPAAVEGAMVELSSILSLPTGYQRDLQATKPPILRGIGQGMAALAILPDLVRALDFDRERMRAAISPDMYATDRAVELAVSGLPFRTAYRKVAEEPAELEGRTPEQSLAARTSPGAPGALGLDAFRARLTAMREASRQQAEARARLK